MAITSANTVTIADKVDAQQNSNPANQKIAASDFNTLKTVINQHATVLGEADTALDALPGVYLKQTNAASTYVAQSALAPTQYDETTSVLKFGQVISHSVFGTPGTPSTVDTFTIDTATAVNGGGSDLYTQTPAFPTLPSGGGITYYYQGDFSNWSNSGVNNWSIRRVSDTEYVVAFLGVISTSIS